jgi:carbon monoxide dehydrogenase subunit G
MRLEHEFTVPAPIEQAWQVLLDVERVTPCLPGATLLSAQGESFTGSVKVKVGPIQVTYKGDARFTTRDEQAHRVVIEAAGKESRGSGTASATVTAQLTEAGGQTTVTVETDLDVTGRPAQFGRGVMSEVGGRLVEQFAQRLAEELALPAGEGSAGEGSAGEESVAGEAPAAEGAGAAGGAGEAAVGGGEHAGSVRPEPPTAAAAGQPRPPGAAAAAAHPRPAAEPIDLLEIAGPSVVKRLAPVAAVVVVLLLLLLRRRRRR